MIDITHPHARFQKISSEVKDGFQEATSVQKTWVVSDLRSKFEIQNLLLEKQGFFEDLDVIRASELWRLLLRRVRPDLRVVSADLIRALVKDQMDNLKLDLGSSSDQAICDFMDQFAPVIFNSAGAQQLKEWFELNPQSYERWGSWYRLAEQFAPYFLDRSLVAPAWVASVLLDELQKQVYFHQYWSRNLVIDLGCEMMQVESDLIQLLAREVECDVLRPAPKFKKNFEALLFPYEQLPAVSYRTISIESAVANDMAKANSAVSEVKALRFSGRLAEIKHCVHQVRQWLDSGVPLASIALLAPNIEDYWSVLSEYLTVEGVPTQKDVSSRLQSIPIVHQWLATLRIRAGMIEPGLLELATYGTALQEHEQRASWIEMRLEDFQALFKNILSTQDFDRSEAIKQNFGRSFIGNQSNLTLEEFLGAALPLWKRVDQAEILEEILKEILSKIDFGTKHQMKLSNWLFLIDRMLSKKEIVVQPGHRHGIVVANFSDGETLNITHRLFLGLSQSQLKSQSIAWVLPSEIHSFNQSHGFYLMNPDVSRTLFELEWLNLQFCKVNHFCFPGTQWDGSEETPSQFWMEMKIKLDGLESLHAIAHPGSTRWDEIQEGVHTEDLLSASMQGRTLVPIQKFHLSASSLQRFRDCPFVFFAEKALGLSDPPEIDLDLDRRSKGRLIHSILEQVTAPEKFTQWTEDEVRALLEQEREKLPSGFIHDGLWGPLREKNLNIVMRFQEQEKRWRHQYPDSKILGRELSFDFDFEGFRFKGVLDRVDGDSARVVVLDYKTTEASVKTFQRWFEDNQLQLGFYTWIVEKGFIEAIGARQVVGALFYVLKTMDRSTGFKISEAIGLLDHERKKSHISIETKNEFLKNLEIEIKNVIHKISNGEFRPQPRDLDLCEPCRWRGLCRAPHLI